MAVQRAEKRKCYGQFCPVATALDFIGDRWTVLILRELLGGAARFQELQEGLQGVPKNLLSDRLRRLEKDEIVRRFRSHNAMFYALTERGAASRRLVEELGFWGASLSPLEPPKHPRSVRAIAMALHALLTRAGDRSVDTRYAIELDVDGEPIRILLGARPGATAETSSDADARIRVPRQTLSAFLNGRRINQKEFVLASGDEAARIALLEALGISATAT